MRRGVSLAAALLLAAQPAVQPAWADGLFNGSLTPSHVAIAPPNWATYTGNFQGMTFNLGNYPANALFGAGNFPVAEALTGMLNVPATATGANAGFAVAGYGRSLSTSQGAVGVFGGGRMAANGVSTWGSNFVVNNCGGGLCPPKTGLTAGVLYGSEIDVNIGSLPDGTAPTGIARGLYIIGVSDVRPSGGMFGIDIESPGIGATPKVHWNAGVVVADDSADIGVLVGAIGTGAGHGSQPILFNGYDSGGTNRQATVVMDQFGNLLLNPSGGNSVVANGPLSVSGRIGATGRAPTAGACTVGAGSNDTRGTLTVSAAGATSCAVSYAAPTAQTQFCIVSGNVPGVALAVTASSTTGFTIGFPASVSASQQATWQCLQ